MAPAEAVARSGCIDGATRVSHSSSLSSLASPKGEATQRQLRPGSNPGRGGAVAPTEAFSRVVLRVAAEMEALIEGGGRERDGREDGGGGGEGSALRAGR